MMKTQARGVTLLEGMISTVILLVGMVGVLQGVAIASQQNAIANRHMRASIIANELIAGIEQNGRARNIAAGGLFVSPQCQPTIPMAAVPFTGELQPMPASFGAGAAPMLGWGAATNVCFIDFDSLAPALKAITPGYTADDDTTYTRLVGVFTHATNTEVTYVMVNVGWRDAGQVRIVKRVTAIYNTAVNGTNLEY
jgi:hypothetical protein